MTHSRADYPLAETQPGSVSGPRGKRLSDITLESVLDGTTSMDDLRITPAALRAQADIAADAGRPTLAQNFKRAAELVNVPQELLMEIYELLRPGRAGTKQQLLDAAERLQGDYGANGMAAFIREAADTYEERGLFTFRF